MPGAGKIMSIERFLRKTGAHRSNPGHCPICEKDTTFVEYAVWLRDYYQCVKCHSIPRERAIITAMNRYMPSWRDMAIHESSPGTASSAYIGRHCKNYSYSQFYPGVKLGESNNGTRCENLEMLTFGDGSFDAFVTQDVFEHVTEPEKAFGEIGRVLKPGGCHIFTVPIYNDMERSRPRIEIAGGTVRHLLDPVYHGNPIDPKGSLVTWDYGRDLPALIFKWSGLYTTVYHMRDRALGIDGEFLEVLISRKL